MANRGTRLPQEKVEAIKKAIARGMARKDVVKVFKISYNTYNSIAEKPATKKVTGDNAEARKIAEAVKIVANTIKALEYLIRQNSENEAV